MMVLRSSPASPFGRKVIIAAAFAGLTDKLEVVATNTGDPADAIFKYNPLGKIPALTLPNGATYFDSAVIVDYLDYLAGGGVLVPAAPEDKFKTLTLAALADGIADASLLQVYERRLREVEKQDPKWLAWPEGKVTRGLTALENAPPAGARTIAHIAVACALGYLDLRFAGSWRKDHPNLVKWLEDFSAEIPAYAASNPQ